MENICRAPAPPPSHLETFCLHLFERSAALTHRLWDLALLLRTRSSRHARWVPPGLLSRQEHDMISWLRRHGVHLPGNCSSTCRCRVCWHTLACVAGTGPRSETRGETCSRTAPGWQWARSLGGRKQEGSSITGFPSLEIILKKTIDNNFF